MNINWLPTTIRRHYPHLIASDIEIWNRFLHSDGNHYDAVAYDVHVGHGEIPLTNVTPAIAHDMKTLTQKRIDAVLTTPEKHYIAEIKKRAGSWAVGQALVNDFLYRQTFIPELPTVPMIVTDKPQPDIADVCDHYGIILFQV